MSTSVCISYSTTTSDLAEKLTAKLKAYGCMVTQDHPVTKNTVERWGKDHLHAIESVLGAAQYCILLLDKSYRDDRYSSYRRNILLDAITERRAFVLPVQVGTENTEVHGLTNHLGKLRVAIDDAESIFSTFIEKIRTVGEIQQDGFSKPLDLENALRLYMSSAQVKTIESFASKQDKIGYDLCRTHDNVTGQTTHFFLIYQGANLAATIERMASIHRHEIISHPLIAIVNRQKTHVRSSVRPKFVASIFKNSNLRLTNTFYVDEFVWRNCTPASFQVPEPRFEIRGFVEPAVKEKIELGALELIRDWHNNRAAAILVITGPGGVGKTTLAKAFANELSGTQGLRTFFVDDLTIFKYFMQTGNVGNDFTIYDAYRAFMFQEGAHSESLDVLSPERFFLNFNAGNILIIIDGLDQVVARLGNKFNVESFLASIYPEDFLQKRKVIVTCRAPFLPESYLSLQVNVADVAPFDEDRARKFLGQIFEQEKTITKGLQLASALTRRKDDHHYYPFVLDIVSNLIRQKDDDPADSRDFDKEITGEPNVLSMKIDNDFVLQKICAREEVKYSFPHGMTVKQQLDCLMTLAVQHRGMASRETVGTAMRIATGRAMSPGEVSLFAAHPLLQEEGLAISFRYDVIREHLKNIFASSLFTDAIADAPNIVSVLAERNQFSRDSVRLSVSRIGLSGDDMTLRALSILDSIDNTNEEIDPSERSRAKTSVLLMVLQFLARSRALSGPENTQVLQNLFGAGANTIVGACIVDVSEKLLFDFSGHSFQNCEFTNYSDFWHCSFDSNTHFSNCVFRLLPKADDHATEARRLNFDLSNCTVDNSVSDALATQRERIASARRKKYEDLIEFLGLFYVGGRFLNQKEGKIRARYRGSWDVQQLIRDLKKAGVIEHFENPKKPTLGPELSVMRPFQPDVVKLLTENFLTATLRSIVHELTN